jgi:hypothetical protein
MENRRSYGLANRSIRNTSTALILGGKSDNRAGFRVGDGIIFHPYFALDMLRPGPGIVGGQPKVF